MPRFLLCPVTRAYHSLMNDSERVSCSRLCGAGSVRFDQNTAPPAFEQAICRVVERLAVVAPAVVRTDIEHPTAQRHAMHGPALQQRPHVLRSPSVQQQNTPRAQQDVSTLNSRRSRSIPAARKSKSCLRASFQPLPPTGCYCVRPSISMSSCDSVTPEAERPALGPRGRQAARTCPTR